MKLERVTTHALAVPVGRPTRISTRTITERHYLVAEVVTDRGTGLGYAYAGTSGARLLGQCVDELVVPALRRADIGNISGAWEAMYQETLLAGRRGVVIRALSALDMALWDLRAKMAGLPLAMVLGGATRSAVPAYASGGYYRADDQSPVAAVESEIQDNIDAGFLDHKIKVGGLPVLDDAARVAAAIKVIDGRGRLALDANNAYSSVGQAVRAVNAFEEAAGDHGIWWFEEPLSADDVEGHFELARRIDTPVATGELHQTRWEFAPLIKDRHINPIQPDVGVVGGVTEWMRVGQAAASFGLQVAPHWHANSHVHLAAALPNVVSIEHFALEKDIYNFERLLTDETRLVVANGFAEVPSRPGLGIDFDPKALRRFRLS